MPFPGIPTGSELEKKIDRCVVRVTATGRDKSAAIAICRASIEGESTKAHESAMISLTVPAGIAQEFALDGDGALPSSEMHITLAHLGKAADLSESQRRNLHNVLGGVSFNYKPLEAAINGVGRFCNNDPDGDAFFIIPDVPQLPALRQDLVERLEAKNIPSASDHGFVPHISLGYIPHDSDNPFSKVERADGLIFPSISLSLGEEKFDYPFRVETTKARADAVEQARYRDAGPASTQICSTCKFGSNEERQCSLFDFTYNQDWTCDRWEPNIPATRERLRDLQAENKKYMSKRKERIDQARGRIALKREISGAVRRDLGRGDFVFPETRSFPIQRPADVRAAVSSWGRASAVRARGFTFADFKRRLTRIAKRKGAAFVAALPAEWKTESKGADGSPSNVYAHGPGGLLSPGGLRARRKQGNEFSVFKDAKGQHRWLMVSSSAYRDRENEIVSTKALRDAVAEHDATGERGPLRWWHLPIDIGQADFGMVQGRMLIESGTFANETLGAAIAATAKSLEGSLGFTHPKEEPGKQRLFENISIFERSLLPQGKASNLFTSLSVKEINIMSADKIKEFIERVGPEVAAKFLQDADTTDKAADAAGFAYKSHSDLAEMTADQLLEYSLQMKDHEEEQAAREKAAHDDESRAPATRREGDADDDDKRVPSFMKRILKAVESNTAAIKALQGGARKEAPADQFGGIDERLKALEGEQPRAAQTGYRASQHAATTTDEKGADPGDGQADALKELVEGSPQAAPFMQAAQSFGNGVQHPYWGAAPDPGQLAATPVPPPSK